MRGKNILVCSNDKDLVASARRSMESCGSYVMSVGTEQEAARALESGALNLVVVDVQHFDSALGLIDKAQSVLPTIAMTPGEDLQLLKSLVCRMGVANVVARPADNQDGLIELLITADKLLRDDLFGLRKYLRGDVVLQESVLRSANDREPQLERLQSFLRKNKAPRQLIMTIINAADELLTNAIYNAPVDSAGRPLYAATNRRIKIQLRPSEHVHLKYGIRKGVFGMSVTDQFGRVELEHLSKSIRRCVSAADPIEQKAGGAGLGLFMVARTARQFVINVAPGQCTEMIALWNLERRKTRRLASHHSLHFFEQAYRLEKPHRPSRYAAGTCAPTEEWDGGPTRVMSGWGN